MRNLQGTQGTKLIPDFDDRNGWFNSHLYGGVPFSIPLKDCTLIVGPILTLTHWALLLPDFEGAYRNRAQPRKKMKSRCTGKAMQKQSLYSLE